MIGPRIYTALALVLVASACERRAPEWEASNPILPLPEPPLGIEARLTELEDPPTPERVRLGRWLFYDSRLSADGTVSCGTCHRPDHAFSEPSAVSTGIGGQQGGRKAPSFVNQAWTIYPNFFWDGRSSSLEDQALGPIQNPIEMGNTVEAMLTSLEEAGAYAPYFAEAFGDPEITADRVAKAIADYERTRMSGNSPWDRWKDGDQRAMSELAKHGEELFFGKANCNKCHLSQNFTDSRFHNLGVGWTSGRGGFSDEGRYLVTKKDADRGAFKTPTLREASEHAPYMHDGSIPTLRKVIELYNLGGTANPYLDPRIKPLGLTEGEIDALVAFLEALEGEGYHDTPPHSFPSVDRTSMSETDVARAN